MTASNPRASPRLLLVGAAGDCATPAGIGGAEVGIGGGAGVGGAAEIGGGGGVDGGVGRVVTVAVSAEGLDAGGPSGARTVASSKPLASNVRLRLVSAFSISFIDCQREFGSFARQRLIIASSSGGVSGATSANGFTSSRSTDERVEMLEPPSKARRPLTIS